MTRILVGVNCHHGEDSSSPVLSSLFCNCLFTLLPTPPHSQTENSRTDVFNFLFVCLYSNSPEESVGRENQTHVKWMSDLEQIPDEPQIHEFVVTMLTTTGHAYERTVPRDTIYPYFKISPHKHCFTWHERVIQDFTSMLVIFLIIKIILLY